MFSGDKDSISVQQVFLFPDIPDEATATMHLGEIAEVRGVNCIDECCDDLLFTHNDDIWYREKQKHSFFFFFFFFDGFVKRWQPPLFGLSSGTQENMNLLDSMRLLFAMQLL